MAKAPKKRPWPAAKVEMVRVDAITPYQRNPRKHPPSQIETLKKLITEFGFTIPLLLDENSGLIAGEGRLIAAKSLGIEEVPCMTAVGWTAAQRRAYVIADNKVSMASVWDDDMLVMELGDLADDGFDLGLTGFEAGELTAMLHIGGLVDANEVAGTESAADETPVKGNLADRFGIPPFSVFNAREGWWQGRKRAWLTLGIQSEIGRGENLLQFSETMLEPDPERRRKANHARPGGGGRKEQRLARQIQ